MCQGRKHINGIGFEVCFVIFLRHREILLATYLYVYIIECNNDNT